jgi:hypothetical protein
MQVESTRWTTSVKTEKKMNDEQQCKFETWFSGKREDQKGRTAKSYFKIASRSKFDLKLTDQSGISRFTGIAKSRIPKGGKVKRIPRLPTLSLARALSEALKLQNRSGEEVRTM